MTVTLTAPTGPKPSRLLSSLCNIFIYYYLLFCPLSLSFVFSRASKFIFLAKNITIIITWSSVQLVFYNFQIVPRGLEGNMVISRTLHMEDRSSMAFIKLNKGGTSTG